MKKYLLVLLIGFFITVISAQAEQKSEETLVFTTLLYGSDRDVPLNINSDRDWIDLYGIDGELIRNLDEPKNGVVRRWRVKAFYSDNTVAGQSTIQVKIITEQDRTPLFTMPWSEGQSGWKENFSNWFQTDFNGSVPLLSGEGLTSVRLVAPPGSSSPGMIYKLELEAWDIREMETEEHIEAVTQRASVNVIPEIKAVSPEVSEKNRTLQRKEPDSEQALAFALNFVNSGLTGDLPAFYGYLNETVYSLESGYGDSKYRVKPPTQNYSGFSLSNYTEIYEAKIYSYSEYSELFPLWIDESRRWTPDRNTWLYHGSSVKEGSKAVLEGEILVFMVKMIDEEWKIIAIPE